MYGGGVAQSTDTPYSIRATGAHIIANLSGGAVGEFMSNDWGDTWSKETVTRASLPTLFVQQDEVDDAIGSPVR